jgi:hypothetical protein
VEKLGTVSRDLLVQVAYFITHSQMYSSSQLDVTNNNIMGTKAKFVLKFLHDWYLIDILN